MREAWYCDTRMRWHIFACIGAGLGAVIGGGGCLYLEDPNYPPEVQVVPVREGPYYRGEPIEVRPSVQDKNPGDRESLRMMITVTDDKDEPLGEHEVGPCMPDREGCFIPLVLGRVYRVRAVVWDRHGASGTGYRDFVIDNRGPEAGLEAIGKRNKNGHYPLQSEIRFSALSSKDPDSADQCFLSYTFSTVSRPLSSVTGVFVEGMCAQGDVRSSCPNPVPAYCIRPDAPGTYRVRLTVTDPAGAESSTDQSIEVDEDAPPCLTQLVPKPVETIFVSRSEGTRRLSVTVADDLDPWPEGETNAYGYPQFRWSVKTGLDEDFVFVPDSSSNVYELDLGPFSAGEEVFVRVDVMDRVDRTAERPCEKTSPVCPPGADPLDPDACVQRVTWHLEVY